MPSQRRCAAGDVCNVTDATWSVMVMDAPVPVLADFTADWCPPCQSLSPRLRALAAANPGVLRVVSVQVDQCPELVAKYSVQALPTLLLLVNGEVVDSFEGAPPDSVLFDDLHVRIPGLHRAASIPA